MVRMIQVRRARAEEVIDLRHAVLRAGLPRESAMFPGDEAPDTVHVVATEAGGEVVGCATMLRSACGGAPAWQVRGMAVTPRLQRSGVGGLMLKELQRIARDAGDEIQLMWCNARAPAVSFYQRHGWVIASEQFLIETAGPHYKMTRNL